LTEPDKYNELSQLETATIASDFWYWAPNYVQTRDEALKILRPFPDAEWHGEFGKSTFLYDLDKAIDKHQVVCVLKPRRMLITWKIILRFFHKAQFSGTKFPGTSDVYSGAIMSTDEDAVKEFFDRLYNVYDLFPKSLKDLNPLVMRNAMQLKFKKGGLVKGYSLKQSGARGPGYSEILFDEAAFQMFARTTYEGSRPTIGADGRIIIVSTPNGKRNFFYDVWSNQSNDYNEVHRVRLTWDMHPERDQVWLDSIAKTMSPQALAREYLGSFTTAAGRAVFKEEYDSVANESDNEGFLSYIPDKPVLIGWDLGFYNPAVIVGQFNHKDQLVGQHEYFGNQIDIYKFAENFKEKRAAWYPADADFIHFIPHDARINYRAQSKHGHINDYQTLFAIPAPKVGIEMGRFYGEQAYNGLVEIDSRLGAIRTLLRLRADAQAGAVFSKEGCSELIDGFKGGYAYPPEDKIKDTKKFYPEKGDYSHLHDALQMIATGYPVIKYIQKSKDMKPVDYSGTITKKTGVPIGT